MSGLSSAPASVSDEGDVVTAAAAPPIWSVALSGGGHRAALFGLGALLSLTESGLNARVDSIASVSGGSLTNGVLIGHEVDFAHMTTQELKEVCSRLVRCCTFQGTVQWTPRAVGALARIGLGAAASLDGLRRLARRQPSHGLGAAEGALGLAASALALHGLSDVARDAFRQRLGLSASKLCDLDPRVTHVLCATELQSGAHLYMSPRFLYGPHSGRTDLPIVSLVDAVQASACFPPVFPPRVLGLAEVGLASDGQSRGRKLWLTDGGVYDNMADEWIRSTLKHPPRPELPGMSGRADRLLIVNSSRQSTWSKAGPVADVPILGEIAGLIRDVSVMHAQTTATRRSDLVAQFDLARENRSLAAGSDASVGGPAPRRRAAAPLGGTLVHIGTSAAWPLQAAPPPAIDPTDFRLVQQQLLDLPDLVQLLEAGERAAFAPLTLAAMGTRTAVDLLWHGYMQTMLNMRVFENGPWLPMTRAAVSDYVRSCTAA